jgi:rubrerythrin
MPPKPPADPAEVFSFAIGLERALRGLYGSVSQQVAEPDAKEALRQLADDELAHEKLLRSRYDSLGISSPPVEGLLFSLFQQGRETVRWTTSPPEAVRIALALEVRGEQFYASWTEKVSDPRAKEVLKFLTSEEVRHASILTTQYRSLTGEEPKIHPDDLTLIPWPDV